MSIIKLSSRKVLSTPVCMTVLISACEADGTVQHDAQGAAPDQAPIVEQWAEPTIEPPSCVELPAITNFADPLAPGDERVCRLGNRSYTVRAGKTYDPCKPAAVVVDLPDLGESPNVQLGRETFCLGTLCWTGIGSGWAAESDTDGGGFIVVVPHGNVGGGDAAANALRDIVNEVKRIADVDADRVYVSGLGTGSNAAYEATCRQGGVFRGLAPNAGGINCGAITKPVPTIGFGSTADIAYGRSLAAVQNLARLSGCKAEAVAWRRFDGASRDAVCRSDRNDPRAKLVPCNQVTATTVSPTMCRIWTGCREDAEVVWCDVAAANDHGMLNAPIDAHVVYHNATNLNTPSVAWRFFKQFTK